MRAFVFPGQGSQTVGMGRALYETFPAAKEVFQEVDESLGQKLSRLIFEGPVEALMLTENAQPALMAVSLALIKVLEQEGGFIFEKHISVVAGHSLGEYSALASVGVLSISQAAQLLRKRGQAMQQAVPVGQGGMVALLGAEMAQAEELIKKVAQGQVCEIANDNAPGQIVISGHQSALDRAVEQAKSFGLKRALALPVSAPFHCSLMGPAAEVMKEALERVDFQSPLIPVISNVTAKTERNPETLKALLVQQITERVRWRESILHLKELGVTHVIEVGAGKVLTGLIKRIDPELEGFALNEPADIEAFLKEI